MDCYSVESEADTLDFLSPPVKRIHTAYTKYVPLELVNLKNTHLKGFHKTYTSAVPPPLRTGVEPSTSLILTKTLPTQFLKQYSVRNYTTIGSPVPKSQPYTSPKIARNKPLIKVTVIPKTDQIHNPKSYRKRRHIPQKVQSTSSNQENSVQTKNLYLVVAGRRKEKIYEIRTTGSAEFSSEQISQNEETPMNDILNFKQLVQSLNMDRKRKKEKSKNNNQQQTSYNGINYSTECNYTNTTLRDDVYPNKSRVRIYGQLGLTEDDRYVLKYGASVDDKPVMSDAAQLISDFSAFPTVDIDEESPTSVNSINCSIDYNKTPIIFRNQKDSCVQADFNKDYELKKPIVIDCDYKKPSKGTQGTQVNFNIQFASINKPKITKQPKCVDKKVQCYAANETSESYVDDTINTCQNPLVIISVYPKQNPTEAVKSVKTTIENKRSASPAKANVYNRKIDKTTEKLTVELNRREPKRSPMSRSPSPAKKVSKTRLQENKPTETRVLRTCRDRKNPDPTSAIKNIKEVPKKFRFITPSATKPQVLTAKPQVSRNQQHVKKTKLQSHEIGTNTNHSQTKKALVDSYTKNLTSRMAKTIKPRIDTSKVTINIDGEREYYDVQFNQGEVTTDSTVRKKLKDSKSQRSYDEESCASLENLFMQPETKPRTRSLALYDNQSQSGTPLTKHVSRLTIRDSLEISHRREDKGSHGIKNTHTRLMAERNGNTKTDAEFLAPVKHYIGDDCSIYDPMARDREIRQLLGVEKCRPPTSETQQDHISGNNDASSYHCFDQKHGDQKFLTEGSLCSNTKMKTNAVQCDKTYNTKTGTNSNYNEVINKDSTGDRTSLYQELVMNKNTQVFLQVEQFSKQNPITLTRKQYRKVKRTIPKNISKKIRHQKNKCLGPSSQVSVGEIKKKKKFDMNDICNKEVQTEVYDRLKSVEERIQEILDYKIEPKKLKLSTDKTTSKKDKSKGRKVAKKIRDDEVEVAKAIEEVQARRTMSSVEVHYANVFYKHVKFLSKDNVLSTTSLEQGKSFLTIFRGHRKSPTPNLGTSAYSLYSEDCTDTKSIKVLMEPRDLKRRKPFLSRLVSYLVMRSAKGSKQMLNVDPTAYPPTVNSSIDSYHISSSLAGADVSSSIYDTSASFYSNHTIFPVNSKMKRGFFSSVRGFLSSRKS